MSGTMSLENDNPISLKKGDWDWEEQNKLRETSCERCGFPCNNRGDGEQCWIKFCPDGGAGK